LRIFPKYSFKDGQLEVAGTEQLQTVYQITGAGSGWSYKLTAGTWIYYRDNSELIPADEAAKSLQKRSKGNFKTE
jgi:hypothetical protein